MTLVRIIKDWDYPDLLRQTPGCSGEWENIRFTVEPVDTCDYAVVLNRVPIDIDLVCPKERVWAIIQEPPVPEYRWHRKGFHNYSRIFVTDHRLGGEGIIHSQPALPWHVDRDYDMLKRGKMPEKTKGLSWITSNDSDRPGQRQRMNFLRRITGQVEFDLWGKGFTPISDKWDGLAPYRYSLAVENYRGPYYWSEKLVDCFLAWAMPIYYGCTNIEEYFPKESFIKVDINKPESLEIIRDALSSDYWIRNLDAIAYARQLVLEKHQFFPFMANLIVGGEANTMIPHGPDALPQAIHLDALPYLYPKPLGRVFKDCSAMVSATITRAGKRLLRG
jgi:hypothetical protein